jgi:hypothetical protein
MQGWLSREPGGWMNVDRSFLLFVAGVGLWEVTEVSAGDEGEQTQAGYKQVTGGMSSDKVC